MKIVMLAGAGFFAATTTFLTNWLALIPWRRAQGQHWTERARLNYPVRVAATSNLWVVPAALTVCSLLLWPDQSPHWALLVLVAGVGTVIGNLPIEREVFPRVSLRDLLRQMAVACLIRFLMWFLFLTAAALMPIHFNPTAALVALGVVVVWIVWNHSGWLYIGRKLGLFLPPPERLENIVEETSNRMNVAYNQIWLMHVSFAQAFAVPGSRVLLFSQRLLELLSDKEIAAICSHELAHLAEARQHYMQRYVIWLTFLPWILFKPMLHTFGVAGFFLLLLPTVMTPVLYRGISKKLEVRADKVAHLNEEEPGTYARALLRLHEDALVPAVMAKDRATHPHLYDRLVAAGLTPDFPRPRPAVAMAWPGFLWSTLLGGTAMLLILRLTQQQ